MATITHARRPRRRRAFLAILAAAGLATAAVFAGNSGGGKPASAASDKSNNKHSNTVVLVAGKGCDVNYVATQAMLNQGFVQEEFTVGQSNIDWKAAEANTRGSTAFTTSTEKSAKEVVKNLGAKTPQGKAALETLEKQSGATREQVLDPANWTPVQFKVDIKLPGNTAFRGGEAVPAGERKSQAGDVVWLFVHPDECVQVTNGDMPPQDAVTAHRAGCGNPQTELPVPSNPTTPKVPVCIYNPSLPPDSPFCVKTDDGQLGGGREVNQGQGCPYQEYPGGPCLAARSADSWVAPGAQPANGIAPGTTDPPPTTPTTAPPAPVAQPQPGTGSGGTHSGDPCTTTPKPDYCP